MSQIMKKDATLSESSSTAIPTATTVSEAVIVCNGPSLINVPLDWLSSHATFGANRVYLLPGFQPSYYTCIDMRVLNNVELRAEVEIYGSQSSIAFVNREVDHVWPPNFVPLQCMTPYDDDGNYMDEFSMEVHKVIVEGGTVTYVQMQLAYSMGYRRLYLVGLDHTSHDDAYFHPDYSEPFETKDFTESDYQKLTEMYYRRANEIFEGQIINLTPGSQLDVFENRSDSLQWSEPR